MALPSQNLGPRGWRWGRTAAHLYRPAAGSEVPHGGSLGSREHEADPGAAGGLLGRESRGQAAMGMRRVGAGGRAAGDVGVHAQLDGARGPRPHLPAAVHGQHAAPLASAPARGYCDSGLLLLLAVNAGSDKMASRITS